VPPLPPRPREQTRTARLAAKLTRSAAARGVSRFSPAVALPRSGCARSAQKRSARLSASRIWYATDSGPPSTGRGSVSLSAATPSSRAAGLLGDWLRLSHASIAAFPTERRQRVPSRTGAWPPSRCTRGKAYAAFTSIGASASGCSGTVAAVVSSTIGSFSSDKSPSGVSTSCNIRAAASDAPAAIDAASAASMSSAQRDRCAPGAPCASAPARPQLARGQRGGRQRLGAGEEARRPMGACPRHKPRTACRSPKPPL